MHVVHIKQTLKILRERHFFAKASKYACGQHELEYLGHIVMPQEVKVDNHKITAVVA